MSVDRFLVPGERLLWSRESQWKERFIVRYAVYLFGALSIVMSLVGIIFCFISLIPRATSVLFVVMGPIMFVSSLGLVYFVGLMAPITFAVTDRRVISATLFRGNTIIQSWLLQDIENPKIMTRSKILGTGVSFSSSSSKPLLIQTSQNEADHVLQTLSDAIAQSSGQRQRPNEIAPPSSNGSSGDLFSMPESLQQLVRSSGGDIRLLSSQPLFKHVWGEAFGVWIGIAACGLLSWLIIVAVSSSPSAESPAAPIAANITAPISSAAPSHDSTDAVAFSFKVIGGMCSFVFLFFLHMTLSTGVAGRLSVAITSSKIIFVKTWFGSSLSFGATSRSLRKVIQNSCVTIPGAQGCCITSTGSIYINSQTVPLPNTLSTYNWILCEALNAPDTDAPLL